MLDIIRTKHIPPQELEEMYTNSLKEAEKKLIQARANYLMVHRQLETLNEDYQKWRSSISSQESEK